MQLITTNSALRDFCARVAAEPCLAVDTEFIRETTFWPELCLIQAAGAETAALIDPLAANLDLAPFFRLLQNPAICKVLHGGQQDIEIFYHLSGAMPTPVFDTQIAAMACGFGNAVGYETLVQALLDKTLNKRERLTDWRRRPLAQEQLTYALADVTHLHALYHHLRAALASRKRSDWIKDETAKLTDPALYDMTVDRVWQRLMLQDKRVGVRAVGYALTAWREQEAQRRNRPRRHILKDELLRLLAKTPPRSAQDLRGQRNLPLGFRHGKLALSLLPVIEKALRDPAKTAPPPAPSAPPPRAAALPGLLKLLLAHCADAHQVAPKLLASADELAAFASAEPPSDSPILRGWRREIFGRHLLALLAGGLCLRIRDGALDFVPLTGNKLPQTEAHQNADRSRQRHREQEPQKAEQIAARGQGENHPDRMQRHPIANQKG